jgi:hypothetical protein
MAFTADSPLASRVVESPSSEVGVRSVSSIRAICIHMAEGGGTVSWLTRPDGNSSHYVVEYTGRITQMVRESYWAGSINPRLVRTTNDPPYEYLGETIRYGRSAAEQALGSGVTNPNLHVVAIEVEGFAKDGPNAAERESLRKLVADIRRRRGALPCLGHRDFQDYKACPGKRIPWVDYGGHGFSEDPDMTQAAITTVTPKLIDVPVGVPLLDIDGKTQLFTNRVDRPGIYSPYGCGTVDGKRRRAFYTDPDGAGDDYHRMILLVLVPDSAIHPIPTPEPPAPAPAEYTVEVGGKPVGSVTLP